MTTTVSPAAAAAAVAEQVKIRRRLPAPAMRRALRVSSGLSAAELAGMMGVTRQAVSKYERGLRTPRGQLLEAYVAVLHELAEPPTSGDPSEALIDIAVDHGLAETAREVVRHEP